MYYILYEGLQIKSNEPVYCTLYTYIYYSTNTLVWKYKINNVDLSENVS